MQHTERINAVRLRALVVLRYGTTDAFHRSMPLCARAVSKYVAAGALPPVLADAFRAELGPEGWAFITGATDTLQAPPVAPEVQS